MLENHWIWSEMFPKLFLDAPKKQLTLDYGVSRYSSFEPLLFLNFCLVESTSVSFKFPNDSQNSFTQCSSSMFCVSVWPSCVSLLLKFLYRLLNLFQVFWKSYLSSVFSFAFFYHVIYLLLSVGTIFISKGVFFVEF